MYQFSSKPHLSWLCWLNFHLFHRSQRTKTLPFHRFIDLLIKCLCHWLPMTLSSSEQLKQGITIKTIFKKTKWGRTSWEEQQTRFCLKLPFWCDTNIRAFSKPWHFFVLYLCKKIWKREKPFCSSACRDIHRILSQKSRWWLLEQYNQSSQRFYSFVLQKSRQPDTNTTSLMPWFALK